MTHYFLFTIVILFAATYGSKYAKKVESENDKKNQSKELDYLKENIFFGLKNMNDGFDSDSIYYFSESDFEIVIKRVEKHGIGIMGIEPWLNGEFYDVKVAEDYGEHVNEPKWYKKAFNEFKEIKEKNLLYSASYKIS